MIYISKNISKPNFFNMSIMIFLLIFLSMGTAYSEEPKNYCNDIEQWNAWSNLVHKFPDDDNVAIGYALRIGLCEQIKNKTIETGRAIELFDRYMQALQDATAFEELKAARLKNEVGI